MAELSNSTIKDQRDAAFRFRGQSIVYRRLTQTTNHKTGQVTTTVSETTLSDPGVLTSQVDDKTVRQSAGRYQVGDRIFRVRHSDMPETPPKTTNEISFNGAIYKIIEHKRSADGNVWDIVGRVT